jgi:hypothetical protein
MIFMALALTGSNTKPGIGYKMGMAGDQTGLRLPLILTQEVNPQAFVGILGMGFMLLLPEVVKITKKLVGAKEGPFDQFKDAALKNFNAGWKGNKYVPGAKKVITGGLSAAGMGVGGAIAGNQMARRGQLGPDWQSPGKTALAGLLGGLGGGIVGGVGIKRSLNIAKKPISFIGGLKRDADSAQDAVVSTRSALSALGLLRKLGEKTPAQPTSPSATTPEQQRNRRREI